MRLSKKLAIAAVSTVAAVGIATSAFAYFTTTGSGSGNATVGTSSNWAISNVALSGGPLYPGAGSETLSYTVTNPSSGHQGLNGIAVSVVTSGGNVVDSVSGNAVGGCLASWFVVDNTNHAATGDYAGGQAGNGSAGVSMSNDTANSQDSCKSVSPKLNIAAN